MSSNNFYPLSKILNLNIDNHKEEIKYISKNPIMSYKPAEEINSTIWNQTSTEKLKSGRRNSENGKFKSSRDDFPERVIQVTLATDLTKKPTKKSKRQNLRSLDANCNIGELKTVLPPLENVSRREYDSPRLPEKVSFTSPRYEPLRKTQTQVVPVDVGTQYLLPRYRSRYLEMVRFREQVLCQEDDRQRPLLTSEGLVAKLETRLNTKLTDLTASGKTPNFMRLQAFSETFDDIINESWMFAPIFTHIKSAYDSEVDRVLQLPIVSRDAEVDQLKGSIPRREELQSAQLEVEQLREALQLSFSSGKKQDELLTEEESRLETLIVAKEKKELEKSQSRQMWIATAVTEAPTEAEKLETLKDQCWRLLDELSDMQTDIRQNLSPVATISHLQDGLQDASIELEKLKYQKTMLTKETDEMIQELKVFLQETEMPEEDLRRINSVLLTDTLMPLTDYEESTKWSWYIS